MSKQDLVWFSGAGLLIWFAASAFYVAFGEGLLEIAFWFYALNAFLATGAAALAFQTVVRLRHTPRRDRLVPALAFTLPAFTAGVLLLTVGRPLLHETHDGSLGRYALFLAACYGAVIAHAIETKFETEPARA